MAVNRSGSSAPSTDPVAILAKAKAKVKGNPDEVRAFIDAMISALLEDTPDTASAAEVYKSAPKPAKDTIAALAVALSEVAKANPSTKSTSKAPAEVVAKAKELYKVGRDDPNNLTGDLLEQFVSGQLFTEFNGKFEPSEIIAAQKEGAK